MAPVEPSQEELDRRNAGSCCCVIMVNGLTSGQTVGINDETVTDITSTDFPGHYTGEDHAWSLDKFSKNFTVKFHRNERYEAAFSLIGIDASIANALRRILIAEMPTLAIEHVFIENNTSVIQDEVLAHRLGLIPFKGNKDGILNFMKWWHRPDSGSAMEGLTDFNTVRLSLRVKCTRNRDAAKNESDPTKLYHHAHVYARDIVFEPVDRQNEFFTGPENAIQPVNPDILIAKMRPGQEIDCYMHMHKGVGQDHAKFSPVATASYRLMPTITITKPIVGEDAAKFAGCFPQGVIGLEKVTRKEARTQGSGYEGHEGKKKAVVKDPMRDTVSREVLRHPEFKDKVKLGRRRDHFIFSVESTGQWDSDELFMESIKHLKLKCERLQKQVVNMVR
jgi:DNA-directed RNA polymerases I and III subunit RPAC1